MALNIAVPLSGVGDLLENFGLLSPISPIAECRDRLKSLLISPIASESSGISSLDSEEIKRKTASPSPATTTDEEEEAAEVESESSDNKKDSDSETDTDNTENDSESSESDCDSESDNEKESVSSSDVEIENELKIDDKVEIQVDEVEVVQKELKTIINGRDILDLGSYLSGKSFAFNYAQLPENDNIHFFLDNRSQYHRLGATGHIQEYTMEQCKCCEFQFPVNGVQNSGAHATTAGLASNLLSFNINQIIGANNTNNINNNASKGNNTMNRGLKSLMNNVNMNSQMNKNFRLNGQTNPFSGSMPTQQSQRNNYNMTASQNYGNKFNNHMNGAQSIRNGLTVSDMASAAGGNGNNYYNNIQTASYYNYSDKATQIRGFNTTSAAPFNNNSYNNYNNNNKNFNFYSKNMM